MCSQYPLFNSTALFFTPLIARFDAYKKGVQSDKGWFGFAQQFLAVSATIVLEGSPTSYAQFRQWSGFSDGSPSSVANATIEVDFRTEQADCLLLYADSRDGRYVQVTIAGGAARLRYNWGAVGGSGGPNDAVDRVLTVRDVGKVGQTVVSR